MVEQYDEGNLLLKCLMLDKLWKELKDFQNFNEFCQNVNFKCT